MYQIEGKQKYQTKRNCTPHIAIVYALIRVSNLWNNYVYIHFNVKKIVAQKVSI